MTAAEANGLSSAEKADFNTAAFLRQPSDCNSSILSQDRQNEINAKGTPALSSPAGWIPIGRNDIENRDLVGKKGGRNGWPRDDGYTLKTIWSHSDFILVPYFYTYPLYEDLIQKIENLESHNPGENHEESL